MKHRKAAVTLSKFQRKPRLAGDLSGMQKLKLSVAATGPLFFYDLVLWYYVIRSFSLVLPLCHDHW